MCAEEMVPPQSVRLLLRRNITSSFPDPENRDPVPVCIVQTHLQRIVNDIHSIYIYVYICHIYEAIRAYALLPRLARIDTTTTISIRKGSEELHLQYSCRIEPQPRKEVLLRRP